MGDIVNGDKIVFGNNSRMIKIEMKNYFGSDSNKDEDTRGSGIVEAEEADFEEVKDVSPSVKTPSEPKKKKESQKPAKPRVTMTFSKKGKVTDGHLSLIFIKLTTEEWIDGNEADFKALFSGKLDDDCILTWKKTFGRSTLVELFKQFVNTGLIIVPDGYTIPAILEGHFKDENGEWLTGLAKGDKPNDKGLPIITWCVKMLKADPQSILDGALNEEDEFGAEYDSYDHQDMQYHKHE